MELDKKRIIAIIGLVLVAITIGIIIYSVYFKTPATDTTEIQADGEGGVVNQLDLGGDRDTTLGDEPISIINPAEQPEVYSSASEIPPGTTGPVLVATTPVVQVPTAGVSISPDTGMVQYYNKLDGKFYKADADGNNISMSTEVFPSVQKVTWAPNKTMAAIDFPDGNKIVYDFNKQKQYSIPSHWSDLNFSPDSKQIVGKSNSPDPSLRYLFTANTDGTDARAIEPLGENGDKVLASWSPNNQVIAFSRTAPAVGGGADRQGVLLIGKNGENFRQLTVEGLGFQPIWSPSGDRVLYSAHNGASNLMPTLWIDGGTTDTVGAAKNFLDVNTWASKCNFMNDAEVLCAVPDPERLIPGIGFAPQLATETNDTIYKINIRSGLKTLVGKPEGDRTIQTVTPSPDGQYAFLTDQISGEVIKMRLK